MSIPNNYKGDSLPMIIFFNGLGESGAGLVTDTTKGQLSANGPHSFIKQGWDGRIVLSKDTIRPFIISVQSSAWQHGKDIKPIVLKIIDRFPKVKNLHFTGLSMGPWTAGAIVTYRALVGDTLMMYKVTSIASVKGLQFANDEPNMVGQSLPYPQRYQAWTRNAGGKILMIESSGDDRGGKKLDSALKPNSQFIISNLGSTGHAAFNEFFGGGGRQPAILPIGGTNQNIYQWMIRQGDTTTSTPLPPPTPIAPTIIASADTITLPTDSVTLTAYPTNGYSYEWKQLSGPTLPVQFIPFSSSITLRGLLSGKYTWQVKVSNMSTSATQQINFNVLSNYKILDTYLLIQQTDGKIELKKQ